MRLGASGSEAPRGSSLLLTIELPSNTYFVSLVRSVRDAVSEFEYLPEQLYRFSTQKRSLIHHVL